MTLDAPARRDETKRQRLPRGLVFLLAIGTIVVIPSVALSILASRPLDLERLSREATPFVERGGRRLPKAGCGLNEQPTETGCAVMATTFSSLPVSFASSNPERGLAELRGTLTIPDGAADRRPGVLLIGGSGPTDRDCVTSGNLVVRHARFGFLQAVAELLSRQGLVVLRYDKRSCGRCYPNAGADPAGFRFQHLVDDAADAAQYLRARDEVAAGAIVIAGHSQGGQLAPFVAAGERSVAAVILLAGTTQTMEEGLTGQLERFARLRLEQLDVLGALGARAQRDRYQRCFDRLRSAFDPTEQCMGGGVTQQALLEGEELARKTVDRLRELTVPVLAVQGVLDRNTDPQVAVILREIMSSRDGEVHFVAGVGHSLTDAARPADRQLAPVVTRAIGEFLRTVRPTEPFP